MESGATGSEPNRLGFASDILSLAYLFFGLFDSSQKEHLVFVLKVALKVGFVQGFDRLEGIFEFNPVELNLQLFSVVTLL